MNVSLTICCNLSALIFDDLTKLRPLGEVLEVETNVIGLRQMIKVTWIEFEHVCRRHRPDESHLCSSPRESCGKLYVTPNLDLANPRKQKELVWLLRAFVSDVMRLKGSTRVMSEEVKCNEHQP